MGTYVYWRAVQQNQHGRIPILAVLVFLVAPLTIVLLNRPRSLLPKLTEDKPYRSGVVFVLYRPGQVGRPLKSF